MKRLIPFLLVLLIPVAVLADDLVGAITETHYTVNRTIKRLDLDWQSGTNGVVSSNTAATVCGIIERVTIIPDTGATVPVGAYDMTLDDVDDVDMLAGKGANLTSNTTISVIAGMLPFGAGKMASTNLMPYSVSSKLTLEITNAGSERGGVVRIYYRP